MSSVSVLFSTQCSYYLQTGSGLVPKIAMLFMKTLVEAFQSVGARGWNDAGFGRGKAWGLGFEGAKTQGVWICVCQLPVWESVLVCLDERNSVWWGKREALICGRRKIALLDKQSSGELPARLSPLSALITDQFITRFAFPKNKQSRNLKRVSIGLQDETLAKLP